MKIELIIEFLAHVIVCDCQIDNRELEIIEAFITENNCDNILKETINDILTKSPEIEEQNKTILKLANSDKETIEQAVIAGLSVAYSDKYFDKTEQDLFHRFINITKFDRDRFLDLKQIALGNISKEDTHQQDNKLLNFSAPILKPLLSRLGNVTTGSLKAKIEKLQTKLLLAGDDYNDAINKCAKIAITDFNYVENIFTQNTIQFNDLIGSINQTLTTINKIDTDEGKIVKKQLKKFQQDIREIILQSLEESQETIYKKRRAVNSFTISFLGKTKAGKSTLHAIITGQGKENIGVGKQRTTRCNRVYSWQNIRIIDTPGIGAPHGRTDEQIAESIVDESDIICYILKNDSVQESELKFLELIKKKNKPVIIILNVKENIQNSTHLKLYLKKPEHWLTRTDGKSLKGHISRIKGYAKKYYKNDYFDIFPIQLLAAQLSQAPEYNKYSKILYKSSHLQDFLDAIRVSIIENGILKRSQTILDGSAQTVNNSANLLNSISEPLIKLSQQLEKKQPLLAKNMSKHYSNSKENFKVLINLKFDNLKEEAYHFATENYNTSKKELVSKWKNYIKEIGFEKKLQTSIQTVFDEYTMNIENELNELNEDLQLFKELSIGDIDISSYGTFSFQSLFKIGAYLSSLGGAGLLIAGLFSEAALAAALGPVGWILGGLAVGFKLFSLLFEDKGKKKKKAIEAIYSSIVKGLEKGKDEVLKNIETTFGKTHNKLMTNTGNMLNILINGIKDNTKRIIPFVKFMQKQENEINRVFAWRILNFVTKNENIEINHEQIAKKNIKTERERGVNFKIFSSELIASSSAKKITKIIQEDTNFFKIK